MVDVRLSYNPSCVVHQQSEASLVVVQLLSKLMSTLQVWFIFVKSAPHIKTARLAVRRLVLSSTPFCPSNRYPEPGFVESRHQGIQFTWKR